jgi:hypothetical protein
MLPLGWKMSAAKPASFTLDCFGLYSDRIASVSTCRLHTGIKAYVRLVWPDLASLAGIAILLAAIVLAPTHLESYRSSYRVVPMWTVDNGSGFRGPTELSYLYFEPVISSWACALIAVGFPILVGALFQIKIRNWWDFQKVVFGSLKAVVFAYVSQRLLS